ncbi:MAG TPA: PilZ domain-containing protein [Nitrospira sp.]|nr:PilZ domain-containing protein [Nitrospira sp.]
MISLIEFVSICGAATLTAAGASQGLRLLRRSDRQPSEARVSASYDECSGRPAAGAWHEPRSGKRHVATCRIEYVVGNILHEGLLIDMSQRGWRARGVSPVAKGSVMTVHILCSDPVQQISIEEVVVRWTEGLEFGVEVTRISPESAARLSDYLTLRYPPAEPAPVYALSPFSYN